MNDINSHGGKGIGMGSPASSARVESPIASRTRSSKSVASSAPSEPSSTRHDGESSSSDSANTSDLLFSVRKSRKSSLELDSESEPDPETTPKSISKPKIDADDSIPKSITTAISSRSVNSSRRKSKRNDPGYKNKNAEFTPMQQALIVEEMEGSDESACRDLCKNHNVSFEMITTWKDKYRAEEIFLSAAEIKRKRNREYIKRKAESSVDGDGTSHSTSNRKKRTLIVPRKDPEYLDRDSQFTPKEKVAIVELALQDDALSSAGHICNKHDISYEMLTDWKQKYNDGELLLTVAEIREKRKREYRARRSIKNKSGEAENGSTITRRKYRKKNAEYLRKDGLFSPRQKLAIVKEVADTEDPMVLNQICTKHNIPIEMLTEWKDKHHDGELFLTESEIKAKRAQEYRQKSADKKKASALGMSLSDFHSRNDDGESCSHYSRSSRRKDDQKYLRNEAQFTPRQKLAIVEEAMKGKESLEIYDICNKRDIPTSMLTEWIQQYHDGELLLSNEEIKLKRKRENDRRYREKKKALAAVREGQVHDHRYKSRKKPSVVATKKRDVHSASDVSSLSSVGSHSSLSGSEDDSSVVSRSRRKVQTKKKKQSARKSIAVEAAEQGITLGVYKAYLLAKKNREWLLSNAPLGNNANEKEARDEDDVGNKQQSKLATKGIFPLEMQCQYAKERKAHMTNTKKAASTRIMERRAQRAKTTRENVPRYPNNINTSLERIPVNVAKQVLKNIKRRGVGAIGDNIEETVVLEVKRVLASLRQDENGRNKTSSENGDWSEFFVNPMDWEHRDRVGDSATSIYDNMPIPNIDHLVGWATSYQNPSSKKDSSANDNDLHQPGVAHIPAPPPAPSQVEFLLRRFAKRMGQSTTNEKDNELFPRFQRVAKNLDASAGVAMGMAVEEVMTMALMPLAKEHARRCRRLERRNKANDVNHGNTHSHGMKGSTNDPNIAWTLPPSEAVAALAQDPSTNQSRCFLPSSKPPSIPQPTSNNDATENDNLIESSFSRWCKLQGLDPIKVRCDEPTYGLFCEFKSGDENC